MTIAILDGDIFDSGADMLVCPSNCLGTPGKALAAAFARRHPEAVRLYQRACDEHRPHPGSLIIAKPGMRGMPDTGQGVYFAMTKDDWRFPSKIEWIKDCAGALLNRGLACAGTIAIPALGCGEGRLPWDHVRPILVEMAEKLGRAGVKVMLYGPNAGPKKKPRKP